MIFLKKIKLKAVFGGILAFGIFYLGYLFLPDLIVRKSHDPIRAMHLVTIGGYLGWFICGYIAGFLAKKSGVTNAAVVGALSPLLMAIFMLITSNSIGQVAEAFINNGLFWILTGLIMSGLGGLVWDIQIKITQWVKR